MNQSFLNTSPPFALSKANAHVYTRLAFWAWFASGLRIALTYLFFQTNPIAGTVISNLVPWAFVYAIAAVYFMGPRSKIERYSTNCLPWVFAYLAWITLSLVWTRSNSVIAAGGYWLGTTGELVAVYLLLKLGDFGDVSLASLRGYIWSTLILCGVAWTAGTTEELRLGNQEFLHPNAIGNQFAIAAMFSLFFYIVEKNTKWAWISIGLVLALLRSLSKDSILSFVCAAAFYVAVKAQLSKKTKVAIFVCAITLGLISYSFIQAYLDWWLDSPQVSDLAGRTLIWISSAEIALEHPFIGYGFYSFRTIAPYFGNFEAWHAHNEWLQQWVTFGIVGVVLCLAIYIIFLREMKKSNTPQASLGMTLLMYAVLHGLTEASYSDLQLPIRMVVLFSVWAAAQQQIRGSMNQSLCRSRVSFTDSE